MRKTLTTVFAMALLAGSAFGDIDTVVVPVDFTTATQASNEVSTVADAVGYLQQIDIVPSGIFTGNVAITYTPLGGSAVNIYTNISLLTQVILYPAVDKTDINGAALSSDEPTRYLIDKGTVTVTVSNVNKAAATSVDVIIKTEK